MSNLTTVTGSQTMREVFIETTGRLLDENPRLALVLADISAGQDGFEQAERKHPDRIINVGIREQLMIGVAGGLALTGMRPIAHSYAPFLVERPFEQIKLDFENQGVGGVLVSIGASYDRSQSGYTHLSPGDVSLIDSLPDWQIQVPGHPGEVEPMLRAAADTDDRVYIRLSLRQNEEPHADADGRLRILRDGGTATILAIGPMLDNVLAAAEGMDVTVAYTNTARPLDTTGLRELGHDTIAVVQPYLAGTADRQINDAFADRPHRLLSLGARRADLHRYGTADDHDRWHGLDSAGIRRSLTAFGL